MDREAVCALADFAGFSQVASGAMVMLQPSNIVSAIGASLRAVVAL
jgi:hypothetical protein